MQNMVPGAVGCILLCRGGTSSSGHQGHGQRAHPTLFCIQDCAAKSGGEKNCLSRYIQQKNIVVLFLLFFLQVPQANLEQPRKDELGPAYA